MITNARRLPCCRASAGATTASRPALKPCARRRPQVHSRAGPAAAFPTRSMCLRAGASHAGAPAGEPEGGATRDAKIETACARWRDDEIEEFLAQSAVRFAGAVEPLAARMAQLLASPGALCDDDAALLSTLRSEPRESRANAQARRRILAALDDPGVLAGFGEDLARMFGSLGLADAQVERIAAFMSNVLRRLPTLEDASQAIRSLLSREIDTLGTGVGMRETVNAQLMERQNRIYRHLAPFLAGARGGALLDFGAGDGGMSWLISQNVSHDILPLDLDEYSRGGKISPVLNCRAGRLNRLQTSVDAALAINTFAHDEVNRISLGELWRVLRPGARLLVVETIPVGANERELGHSLERAFLTDYVYNRVFHAGALLPIPGCYEPSLEAWLARFAGMGFKVLHREHLGRELSINPNWNLFVALEKPVLPCVGEW
jgi:ubiquinone/menaquinone biosynthesis C-methylase UbiE